MELEGNPSHCYICGYQLKPSLESESESEWVILGTVENKMFADLAREALISSDIPAVVISKSGFFGNVGLTLVPFYRPQSATYEIRVPKIYITEATDLLDMTIGDKWPREDIS